MNGSSKSSNKSTTVNSTHDERIAADGGAIVLRGSGNDFAITDGGAVREMGKVADEAFEAAEGMARLAADVSFDAFGFANEVQEDARHTTNDAFGFAEAALSRSNDLAETSIASTRQALVEVMDKQREETTQLAEKLIRLGIPALALVLIVRSAK